MALKRRPTASARSRRLGVTAFLLGLAGASWSIPGCLDALPPPLPQDGPGPPDAGPPDMEPPDAASQGDAPCSPRADDPPGPLVQATECPDSPAGGAGPGCLDDADFRCLNGETSCGSTPTCALPQASGCLTCPGRVLDAIRAEGPPTCSSIDPGQIAFGSPDRQCLCGNPTCAVACDGQGPVFGAIPDLQSSLTTPILTIPIDSLMPDSGTLGVYLRARGIPRADLVISTESNDLRRYRISSPDPAAFVELVLLDNSTDKDGVPLAKPAYCWKEPQNKPMKISIVPVADGQPSLLEIDCVVPFVLPPASCSL